MLPIPGPLGNRAAQMARKAKLPRLPSFFGKLPCRRGSELKPGPVGRYFLFLTGFPRAGGLCRMAKTHIMERKMKRIG